MEEQENIKLTPSERSDGIISMYNKILEYIGDTQVTLMIHDFENMSELDKGIWRINYLDIDGEITMTATYKGITLFSKSKMRY